MNLKSMYYWSKEIKPSTLTNAVVISEELKKQMERRTITMKKVKLFGNEVKIFIHPFFPDDFVLIGNEQIMRDEGII